MSAHDSTGATGAWGRGFTPFAQPAAAAATQTQPAPSASGSWRGAAAPTAAAPAGRWAKPVDSATGGGSSGASAASTQAQSSGADDSEASSRSWFDGHHGNRKGSDNAGSAAAAAAAASASAGGAWRSGRVDKLRGSGGDSAPDAAAQSTAPAANPRAAAATPAEGSYQASDFGNTHGFTDLVWYYLDPQRSSTQTHARTPPSRCGCAGSHPITRMSGRSFVCFACCCWVMIVLCRLLAVIPSLLSTLVIRHGPSRSLTVSRFL